MESPISLRKTAVVVLIILIGVSLSGCSVWNLINQSSGEDSQYASQEQALESEDDFSEGIDLSGDRESGVETEDDIENVPIFPCPKQATEFTLGVSHKWDYSPGRDLQQMKIDGWTDPFSRCPFTVKGSTVTFPDCLVKIYNKGFSWPGDGLCEYKAEGTAVIEVKSASCSDGNITLTIKEDRSSMDGSGEQICGGKYLQPFYPTYPQSTTTLVFDIQRGGDGITGVQTSKDDPAYRYTKAWTVHTTATDSD